jgi:hypothetical protein
MSLSVEIGFKSYYNEFRTNVRIRLKWNIKGLFKFGNCLKNSLVG